jgi:hypothetical protein
VERPGLPLERVIGALPRPLALLLVGEGGHAHQQLLGRGVDRALAVLEVEEHADAGLRELLQRIGDLDRLAAEARLLGHDEDLEGRPRSERVHQPEVARALQELRAAHAVVSVDVALGDGPALPGRIFPGALELAGDALLLVGEILVGALAGVDRGDHFAPFLLEAFTRLATSAKTSSTFLSGIPCPNMALSS